MTSGEAFDQFVDQWIDEMLRDVPANQREAVLRDQLHAHLCDDRDVALAWHAIADQQRDEAMALAARDQ